jgi:hypothetical protein
MNTSLTKRYGDRLAGVLSCYDRIVITGTLPGACYAAANQRFSRTRSNRPVRVVAFVCKSEAHG